MDKLTCLIQQHFCLAFAVLQCFTLTDISQPTLCIISSLWKTLQYIHFLYSNFQMVHFTIHTPHNIQYRVVYCIVSELGHSAHMTKLTHLAPLHHQIGKMQNLLCNLWTNIWHNKSKLWEFKIQRPSKKSLTTMSVWVRSQQKEMFG